MSDVRHEYHAEMRHDPLIKRCAIRAFSYVPWNRRFFRLRVFIAVIGATVALLCSNPADTPPTPVTSWTMMPDTAVNAGDTLCLFAAAARIGETVAAYLWSFDGGATFSDSTGNGVCCASWSAADTGRRLVVVWARYSSGETSAPESIWVRVNLCRPRVGIAGGASAWAGDTSVVIAEDSAACSKIAAYAWSLDSGKTFADTTRAPFFRVAWTPADTGVRWIAVRSVDALGVVSAPSFLKIHVSVCRPALNLWCDSAVLWQDSLVVRLAAARCSVTAAGFLVSVDDGPADTVAAGPYRRGWTIADTGVHTVTAWIFDKWGVRSDSAQRHVRVTSCRPILHIAADAQALAGTETVLRVASSPACGAPMTYFWSFSSGIISRDTTMDPRIRKTWQLRDTGSVTVTVEAQTREGTRAQSATTTIRVLAGAPVVRLTPDTTVTINDTVTLRAEIVDSSWHIARLLWFIDDETPRSSTQRQLRWWWGKDRAGVHTVRVAAQDGRGVMSATDSVRIRVLLDAPRVVALRDSAVRAGDTATLTMVAYDSVGSIERYYWGVNSFGWTDSFAEPVMRIRIAGGDTLRVAYGARDDDGLFAIESVRLFVNHAPRNARVATVGNSDTAFFSMADLRAGGGRLRFAFFAEDPNGATDTLQYRFSLGKIPAAPAPVYEGTTPLAEVANLDTGVYAWRLVCTDRFGDSAVAAGEIRCWLRRTIGFVGHSIVVGGWGAPHAGGFRREVLDSMRSFYPKSTAIQPVGVMRTGFLEPEVDDSAVALGGIYAAQAIGILIGAPALAADEWVVMLGVNRHYNQDEQRDVPILIDLLHARNPHAPIHVVNGLKCPDSYFWFNYYLPTFNRMLADTVAAKRAQGWDIHLIDAYTAFMDGDARKESYFADDLHPSPQGYGAIARLILQAMGIVP